MDYDLHATNMRDRCDVLLEVLHGDAGAEGLEGSTAAGESTGHGSPAGPPATLV